MVNEDAAGRMYVTRYYIFSWETQQLHFSCFFVLLLQAMQTHTETTSRGLKDKDVKTRINSQEYAISSCMILKCINKDTEKKKVSEWKSIQQRQQGRQEECHKGMRNGQHHQYHLFQTECYFPCFSSSSSNIHCMCCSSVDTNDSERSFFCSLTSSLFPFDTTFSFWDDSPTPSTRVTSPVHTMYITMTE